MDILANIFALFQSFYEGFVFTFEFLYSGHFDNYKILEKILTGQKGNKLNNKNKSDNKNLKEIELSNDFKNTALLNIASN